MLHLSLTKKNHYKYNTFLTLRERYVLKNEKNA